MALQDAFECVADLIPGELKRFQHHIDPVWIEEALEQDEAQADIRSCECSG